jgi:hypothetical protein
MVSLKGKFELADLKAAQDLHARTSKFARWMIIILVGVLALFIITGAVFALKNSMSWTFLTFPVLILGFLALYRYWLRPYQIKRVYTQHKELASPFEMELTEDGYNIKNDYGAGKIPWGDFAKWKEDQKIILLYRTDNMFNMVPKRLLADETQAQYVIEQLKLNHVKEASQVRNPVRTVLWSMVAVLVILVIAVFVWANLR